MTADHADPMPGAPGSDVLANRLRKRRRHLRKWARRTDVTCYRLYERDIPDYPLIVDWYDGDVVAWLYERKRDETPEARAAFESDALAQVRDGLEVTREHVFVKRRRRQRGRDQYEKAGTAGVTKVVAEQGLRFEVNLSDYLDTGLFLDHRPTRAMVRDEAGGKRVLNLFAYTGTFTCYAIDGGAATTTTVDLSNTYCDWVLRNARHNGFRLTEDHVLVREDCLGYLEAADRDGARFDLIVCDPPVFSNSKMMQADSFVVERDHPGLIRRCRALLAPGGVIYFSSNARGLALDEAALPEDLRVRDITARTIPEDFRNERIHRCWRMVREA